jgi:hypothetical protein
MNEGWFLRNAEPSSAYLRIKCSTVLRLSQRIFDRSLSPDTSSGPDHKSGPSFFVDLAGRRTRFLLRQRCSLGGFAQLRQELYQNDESDSKSQRCGRRMLRQVYFPSRIKPYSRGPGVASKGQPASRKACSSIWAATWSRRALRFLWVRPADHSEASASCVLKRSS